MDRAATRLHTVTAVALGVFLGAHLLAVWPLVAGRDAWIAVVAGRGTGHGLGLLVVGVLIAHAVLGARRTLTGGNASAPGGRAMARLQLATGLVTAAFVTMHLIQVDWLSDGPHRGAAHAYAALRRLLAGPTVLLAYLVGITCTVFHVAHGASRMPFAWGMPTTPRTVRVARYTAGLAGALLWLAWLEVLSHISIGTGLVSPGG